LLLASGFLSLAFFDLNKLVAKSHFFVIALFD